MLSGRPINPMFGIHGPRAETFVGVGLTVASAYAAKKKGDREKGYASDDARVTDAYEQEQGQRTAAIQGQIDAAYNSKARQGQYDQFAQQLQQYLAERTQLQQTDQARQQKFAIAGRGLTGGSVDVSAGKRLGRMFADQNVANARQVSSSVEGLRSADDAARLQLRNAAGSGMSLTDAYRRSLDQQQQTLGQASLDAGNQALGDFAGGALTAYKSQRERPRIPPPRAVWGGP